MRGGMLVKKAKWFGQKGKSGGEGKQSTFVPPHFQGTFMGTSKKDKVPYVRPNPPNNQREVFLALKESVVLPSTKPLRSSTAMDQKMKSTMSTTRTMGTQVMNIGVWKSI